MRTPKDDGFFMPGEWRAHTRCWMAWPCRADLWGDDLEAARSTYADVAEAISEFEPVTMLANPEHVAEVSLRFASGVASMPLPMDDSWMRDTGPSFLIDGKGGLAGVDWRFNGWGGKYAPYDQDAAIARALLDQLQVPRYEAPFVLEGGSIAVDGEGTVLTTEQCLLDPNRNPDMDRGAIEEGLKAYLGAETVIWLGRGLEDDETDGHVDNLATFVRPGVVLALTAKNEKDGNYEALQDNLERLRAARDAKGRELEVIEVQQPTRAEDKEGRRLARSYVNLYIANGGVVMPSFEDGRDKAAYDVVSRCFPDRKVRQVLVNDLIVGGGGIHCITQQQPVAEEPPDEDTDSEATD